LAESRPDSHERREGSLDQKVEVEENMASTKESLTFKLLGISATGVVGVCAATFLVASVFLLLIWAATYHPELLDLAAKAITKSSELLGLAARAITKS
jgi:hypothetical protein